MAEGIQIKTPCAERKGQHTVLLFVYSEADFKLSSMYAICLDRLRFPADLSLLH